MPRHGLQVKTRLRLQTHARDAANGSRPGRALRHRGLEQQMRMAVDKAGHHHSSDGAHLDGFARQGQVLDTARGPDLDQLAVAHQQRAVMDHIQLRQRRPAPGLLRSPQSHQLPRAANENGENGVESLPYNTIEDWRVPSWCRMPKAPSGGGKRPIKTLERVFSRAGVGSRTEARS